MSTQTDFAGKVALVTGAARGIGAASVRAFVEAGASVVLTDLVSEVHDVAADMERSGGQVVAAVGDVTQPDFCENVVDLALSSFSRLDFAFNNAGISGQPQDVWDLGVEDWHRVIDVNLNSIFYCVKSQVPAMIRNGGGVIVNNSSVCGVKPIPGSSIEYTTAKHGVIGLTRQLAVNHGKDGIRCVAICPGFIETPLTAAEEKGWFLERIPQARSGQPADIGRAVRMLCSEDAAYMNGEYIIVDGGFVLG